MVGEYRKGLASNVLRRKVGRIHGTGEDEGCVCWEDAAGAGVNHASEHFPMNPATLTLLRPITKTWLKKKKELFSMTQLDLNNPPEQAPLILN